MNSKFCRLFLIAGAIFGLLSVILGAMGSHILKSILSPEYFSAFTTAVYYQFFHALFLLFLGLFISRSDSTGIKPFLICGYLTIGGIILFCGSIYILVITGLRFFGPVTPLGGMLLILSWLIFCVTLIRRKTIP